MQNESVGCADETRAKNLPHGTRPAWAPAPSLADGKIRQEPPRHQYSMRSQGVPHKEAFIVRSARWPPEARPPEGRHAPFPSANAWTGTGRRAEQALQARAQRQGKASYAPSRPQAKGPAAQRRVRSTRRPGGGRGFRQRRAPPAMMRPSASITWNRAIAARRVKTGATSTCSARSPFRKHRPSGFHWRHADVDRS